MSKSSIKSKQNNEQKVLDVLKIQGELKIDSFIKKTGFSAEKILRIQKKLEKTGMIWGYAAIDDTEKQNLIQFIMIVKRSSKTLSGSMRKEIVNQQLDDYLSEEVFIQDIYFTHGLFDAIVIFQAKNIVTANKFVENLKLNIGEYFSDIKLHQILLPVRVRGIKNPDIAKLIDFV